MWPNLRGPTMAAAVLASAVTVGCSEPSLLTASERLDPAAREGSMAPRLASGPDGRLVLSWLEPSGEGHRLRFSRLRDGSWQKLLTAAEGEDWFANWADLPGVTPVAGGSLMAHWLQRNGDGPVAYGVRLARSRDGGRSWSKPVVPHTDRSPTEHGFVAVFPRDDGSAGLAWLDGRQMSGSAHSGPMSLRAATLRLRPGATQAVSQSATRSGSQSTLMTERVAVDERVCDCCKTDAALTADGPVLAFRDRSDEEIRDIAVTRHVDGAWTESTPVHRDGWRIAGCPVNGPSVAADGRRVAVAWFTAADDAPTVKLALSSDAGRSFGEPVAIDDGDPMGRVDVVLNADGGASVSWLERGDTGARLRLRRVGPGGHAEAARTVARVPASRKAGFPQLARAPGGGLVLAWTAVENRETRVRAALVSALGR